MTLSPHPWQSILLPDGSQICLASRPIDPDLLSRFEKNHNLFRLDSSGKVIWQVKRDESGDARWGRMRTKAEAENRDDVWTRSPFAEIHLFFADGTTNADPVTHSLPKRAWWIEGTTVRASTLDGKKYDLDTESGVATRASAAVRTD